MNRGTPPPRFLLSPPLTSQWHLARSDCSVAVELGSYEHSGMRRFRKASENVRVMVGKERKKRRVTGENTKNGEWVHEEGLNNVV